MNYPFEIKPLSIEDGGGFLITFPDFSDCFSDGETIEDAIKNGEDALQATIKTLKEFNFPIPQPSSGGFSGKFVQRLPRTLHQKLAIKAKSEGVSLNALVTALLAESIGKLEKKTA
ncbi:MAG: type II toxin-antitoxin system HicB family antitoxin [Candidatus Riflebacteria bacterium]|nr:type II toxin-antitoxin system HicB family antitoxin [Candidatus Riflebacteria bacterium]